MRATRNALFFRAQPFMRLDAWRLLRLVARTLFDFLSVTSLRFPRPIFLYTLLFGGRHPCENARCRLC